MDAFKILYVEDSQSDADFFLDFLHKRGFKKENIIYVSKKEDVTKHVKAKNISLILCDFDLIDYNAFDIIDIVKNAGYDCPIICLTGTVGEEKAVELLIAGVTDYVIKDKVDRLPNAITNAYKSFLLKRESKQAQQRLVESEKQYRLLFQNMFLGMALHEIVEDENGTPIDYRYIEMNDMGCQILGFKREDIVGKTTSEVFNMPAPPFFKRYLKVAREGEYMRFEAFVKDLNQYFSVMCYSPGYNKFVTLFEDTTKRVKLEREKAQTELLLRSQQRLESIGTLASGVAHEINNPINGIINYGQLILDSKNIELDAIQFAEEIMSEANRIATIVRDLLQFSRQAPQDWEEIEVEQLVSQTLSLIKTIIMQDQIKLKINIKKGLPKITCRPTQIQQVLMNLLTNARSAVMERFGDSDLEKTISLSISDFKVGHKQWARMVVEDNGVGIPEEIHEKIFNPFFTTKDRSAGTGLGLAICYGIVEEHLGSMTFETKENEYTRFIVELPFEHDSEKEKTGLI